MRLHRSTCALAGMVLLAGFTLAVAPSVVRARSSFNNGVTQAIDQIVDLIADGAEGNESRRELRHLHNALEQLLRVLERQGQKGNAHHGHMGKGAKGKHQQKGGHDRCGTIGASAGKGKNANANGAKGGKQGVGSLPGGKNASRKKAGAGNPCDCSVKAGAAPKAGTAKNTGAAPNANRKPSTNGKNAACAKNGVAPRPNPQIATPKAGKLGKAAQCNATIGQKPGNRDTQQKAGAVRNNQAPLKAVALAPSNNKKTAPAPAKFTANPAKIQSKPAGVVNQKTAAPIAAKKNGASDQFSALRTALASRNVGAAVGNRTGPQANTLRRR